MHTTKNQLRIPLSGFGLGLLATVFTCFIILAATFVTVQRNRIHNLQLKDGAYTYANVAIQMQKAKSDGVGAALRNVIPIHVAGDWTETHCLHNVTATLLAPILPIHESTAVVLNGIWFFAMACSAYCLFWQLSKSAMFSWAMVVPLLVMRPLLSGSIKGLTDLDPNILGYMLSVSAMCWVLISNRFQRPIESGLAGVFLGLLALGRVYVGPLVAFAMAPYVISAVVRHNGRDLVKTLRGAAICVAACVAVCGWWLIPSFNVLTAYPGQYEGFGTLGEAHALSLGKDWVKFVANALKESALIVCVLAWRFVVICERENGWRKVLRKLNYTYVWMAIAPLMLLTMMGSSHPLYGWPAMFGVWLTLACPIAGPYEAASERRYQLPLATVICLSVCIFLYYLHRQNSREFLPKSPSVRLLAEIRDDAISSENNSPAIGLACWSWELNGANLVNIWAYDFGLPIDLGDSERPGQQSTVLTPLPYDLWCWDERISGSQTVTPETCVSELTARADYVIVSDQPTSGLPGRRLDASPWREASRRLLNSDEFRIIGGPIDSKLSGKIYALARIRTAPSP